MLLDAQAITPLSVALPALPEAFIAALLAAIRGCSGQFGKAGSLIHLVSVGGFGHQDLPMSGELQATLHLQTCPPLRDLLGCVIPALGRVCLCQTEGLEQTDSLYCNDAHPLFYQTNHVPLGDGWQLLLETRREMFAEYTATLWDTTRLGHPLNLASPQLDVLPPTHVEHCLNTITTQCGSTLDVLCQPVLARWQSVYAQFGNRYAGEWSYQTALNAVHDTLAPAVYAACKALPNSTKRLVEQALHTLVTQLQMFPPAPRRIDRQVLLKARRRQQFEVVDESVVPRFERPVFIVSVPRAGSTLLFETLSQFRDTWSTGEENHALLEDIPGLHPRDHQFDSNRLDATDVNPAVRSTLLKAFTGKLQNRDQCYYLGLASVQRPTGIRFLEKTPKNALRIPFIKALFPDALFVYLHRDFKGNVSSLIDGWRSQRFIAYRDLPGFENRHWSFLLTPGWREYENESLAAIATHQWQTGNSIIQADLEQLPESDWLKIEYQDLVCQPEQVMRNIGSFADLNWDDTIQSRCQNGLPVSRLTLTSPQQSKWRKHQGFLLANSDTDIGRKNVKSC